MFEVRAKKSRSKMRHVVGKVSVGSTAIFPKFSAIVYLGRSFVADIKKSKQCSTIPITLIKKQDNELFANRTCYKRACGEARESTLHEIPGIAPDHTANLRTNKPW